jgi:hypothetical protein
MTHNKRNDLSINTRTGTCEAKDAETEKLSNINQSYIPVFSNITEVITTTYLLG